MTPHVFRQVSAAATTFVALRTLKVTLMNIHMLGQAAPRRETFVAMTAQVQLIRGVRSCVITQLSSLCVTAVVTWTLSDVIAISFSLHLHLLRFITVVRLGLNRLAIPCKHTVHHHHHRRRHHLM